ncbi:tripartite tricarboxylate transporter TctB family protein [Pseudooceanicola aestuarii]|uniref:tripartite tricarboxylate transporter TctB family protein n=1 Tax=Pseudooceanicola aestuarii TaxID=2697319 RepID=UPI0013D84A1E|nr:tripartite tricarboxylate transporter TctB family protein [Pseudooceanicola aestuarii]
MSYRTSTYVTLALLLILAVAYGWQALSFQDMRNRNAVGPGYFPIILSVALAVLCVIAAVQARARADRRIDIPNRGLILATLGASGAFLLAWAKLGGFYAATFVFALALFGLYTPDRRARTLLSRVALAGVVTLFVYLLFGLLIQVRF